jgi:DNA-binding XRE family transcriptional regulator
VNETESQKPKNTLTAIREQMLLSKSELARKAGVSVLTIDRIEKGMSCRMETKRKILTALGIDFSESKKFFND